MLNNNGSNASSSPDTGPLWEQKLTTIASLAKTLRRLKGDESFNAEGVRTIWHRGKQRVELLSWENTSGQIIKQELTFLDNLVDFSAEHGLRTGRIALHEAQTYSGRNAGDMVQLDKTPNPKTLEGATRLIKNAPTRDYYLQHLLKQLHDTVSHLGIDRSRTVVSSLDTYSKSLSAESPAGDESRVVFPGGLSKKNARLVGLIVFGIATGVCVAALLLP